MKKQTGGLIWLLLAWLLCFTIIVQWGHPQHVQAQNRAQFSGVRNAITYAYGTPYAAAPPLYVAVGFNAPGTTTSVSLTLQFGYTVLSDGTYLTPLATTAPITVGSGPNLDTVTPSAVSCTTPQVANTCVITATGFSFGHGIGDPVASATFGLEEAVNAAHTQGGLVAIDGLFAAAGGTTGTVTSNKGYTNVTVLNWFGTTGALSYHSSTNGTNMVSTGVTIY